MGRTDEALARAEQASITRKVEQKNAIQNTKEPGFAGLARQDANAFADIGARLRSLCEEKKCEEHNSEEKNAFSFVIAPLTGSDDLFPLVMELAATIDLYSDLSILVVEANISNPSQGSLQGSSQYKGLTDILAGEEVSPLRFDARNKLYFLPCGTGKKGDTTIFQSTQFSDTMELLQQNFDMLILLAPPVIGHIETQLISLKTDGLVMVIDAGKTRQPVAQRAMDELQSRRVNVLGTILNGREYYIPQFFYKWI